MRIASKTQLGPKPFTQNDIGSKFCEGVTGCLQELKWLYIRTVLLKGNVTTLVTFYSHRTHTRLLNKVLNLLRNYICNQCLLYDKIPYLGSYGLAVASYDITFCNNIYVYQLL